MITTIEGRLAGNTPTGVVVEVGGIGLEVHMSAPAACALGPAGGRVRLFTYLHVREDALTLFGFGSDYERRIFLSLIGISGIGPRVALTMLAHGGAADIARLIRREDVRALVRLPGIGRKTAERLVLELKDSIESPDAEVPTRPSRHSEVFDEAAAALMSLGLTRVNAERALERVSIEGDPSGRTVEEIVRMALRKVPL